MKRDDTDKLAMAEGHPFHMGGVSFQRCLLPFYPDGPGVYKSQPQRPFQPRGLIVWGAPPLAVIAFAIIGNNMQIVASLGSVPARFFAMGDSYEQIAQKLDAGVEPPAWCDWNPVSPGVFVELRFELHGKPMTEPVELVMWGIAAV